MTALTTILLALTSWHDGLPVTLSNFHEPLPTVAAQLQDVHNPDKSLRSRDVLGLAILDGFKYRAESGTWTGGTIYGIHKGKTLKASLQLAGKQSLKAKMSIGLMSRTATLTRAQ
jgi:hypothetical protein